MTFVETGSDDFRRRCGVSRGDPGALREVRRGASLSCDSVAVGPNRIGAAVLEWRPRWRAELTRLWGRLSSERKYLGGRGLRL